MPEKIKYITTYIPAWFCYLVGDVISKIMHTRVTEWLFPVYNITMDCSLFFSDWGNIGVWIDE